jgi:N-acetylneuraminic acid mutarotase
MPTPRSESGVVFLAGKIYVMGGQARHIKKTDIVEVYDLKSKNWSTTASLPLHLDHFAAASNDKIYIIGGSNPNGVSN